MLINCGPFHTTKHTLDGLIQFVGHVVELVGARFYHGSDHMTVRSNLRVTTLLRPYIKVLFSNYLCLFALQVIEMQCTRCTSSSNLV